MGEHRTGIAVAVTVLGFSFAAAAADLEPAIGAAAVPPAVSLPPAPYDWTILIGAEGRFEPIFQGSKDNTWRPYPVFDFHRYGGPDNFRGPRDGIGIGVVNFGGLSIGPVGQLKIARRESDDPTALHGLGNVPWAVELGVFAEYWWVPWLRTRAEVRQGFNGHHGIVSDITADAVVPVGSQLTLSAGPRVEVVTSAATSPYFSINAVQSAASGLAVFDAKGGIRAAGAGGQARYLWTPEWATHAFVEYDRLLGDAANSPLVVQRGSVNQLTLGAGATYNFNIK